MREFAVSYRSPLTMREFAQGTFYANEENLGRNILATICMGYIITEVRLKEDDE